MPAVEPVPTVPTMATEPAVATVPAMATVPTVATAPALPAASTVPLTAHNRKVLTKDDIKNLSVRDAMPWLRKLGLPTTVRTRDGRQALLQKHFEGKEDDYQVEL